MGANFANSPAGLNSVSFTREANALLYDPSEESVNPSAATATPSSLGKLLGKVVAVVIISVLYLKADPASRVVPVRFHTVQDGSRRFKTVLLKTNPLTMGETAPIETPDIRLFRDVFNASPIGIAVENLDGQPLFVNPAFCSMLGFSEEELRSKHCVDFSPPEDAINDWSLFQQLRAGSIDHYQLEKRYFRRDGSLVWGRLSISLLNCRPSPLVVAMVEDITDKKRAQDDLQLERKRSEASLRDSEERFRLAAQAGRMFAYSWDAATDVIERSGEFAEILGVKKEEAATGASVSAMVHPDDKVRLEDALAKLSIENPTLQITYRVIRPDGTVIWVERSSRAYFNAQGKVKRIVGMIVDVTERIKAESKLREYERAVEGSEEMIAVVDREYRYLIANRQFLKMRKMTGEQAVGRFAHEVLNEGAFEAAVKAKLDESFQGKVVRYEMKYTYPELGERDLLVSYFPIEGPSGIDRVACILQDITDRKQMEEALSRMNQKLIESEEQERARIARELHDDINQRLALLALQLAQLQENPSEVRSRLRELRKATTEIANDVQALSHELHSSKLEVLGVVAGIRSWCMEFGERQRMEINFKNDVCSALPLDIGLCLLRVLQEALHNAIKHSGVKRFEVQVVEHSDEVHLIVSDSGRGFDIEAARRGRGLGLTSMQERVRLVNGTIAIDSAPMVGTTVHVRVPLDSKRGSQRAAV